MREWLRDEGYAVATVSNGAAALEMVGTHRPSLILLDLRMPVMDGWAFAREFRRVAGPAATIVVMSAVADIAAAARELGAVDRLAKPFALDDLSRCVFRSLNGGPSPAAADGHGAPARPSGLQPACD